MKRLGNFFSSCPSTKLVSKFFGFWKSKSRSIASNNTISLSWISFRSHGVVYSYSIFAKCLKSRKRQLVPRLTKCLFRYQFCFHKISQPIACNLNASFTIRRTMPTTTGKVSVLVLIKARSFLCFL